MFKVRSKIGAYKQSCALLILYACLPLRIHTICCKSAMALAVPRGQALHVSGSMVH